MGPRFTWARLGGPATVHVLSRTLFTPSSPAAHASFAVHADRAVRVQAHLLALS